MTRTLPRVRVRAYAVTALASLALAALVVALAQPELGDYGFAGGATNADDAGPALGAIVRGDFGRVPALQPVMGPVSLVLRAPFAAVGHALGGRTLEYRLGALACLWALAAVALVLAARLWRRDGGLVAPAAVALVVVANPITLAALSAGHPEEVLGAALACAVVLAAAEDRPTLTGVLLGLALATKPWAALAAPPALLALRGGQRRALALAAGVAGLLVAPLAIADPHRFLFASRVVEHSVRVYPTSVWWPVAIPVHAPNLVGLPNASVWAMPWGLVRSAGELLTIALALGAGLVHLRRWRALPLEVALAFLAAVMLARCALDPMNIDYYAVPFLTALVAWETARRRGLPVVSILVAVAAWATTTHRPASAGLACALYLGWSLPLMAYLGTRGVSRAEDGRVATIDTSDAPSGAGGGSVRARTRPLGRIPQLAKRPFRYSR